VTPGTARDSMASFELEAPVTERNFDETAYLDANPDVAEAVRSGAFASGRAHFDAFGRHEQRRFRRSAALIAEAKRRKHERLRGVLRTDMACSERGDCYDFLTPEHRDRAGVVNTDAVSANSYNERITQLIDELAGGLVLDCGAGRRPVYYDNVVNLEVVAYDTTDVLGVGEELPFRDHAFDAVISKAVLEHVRAPLRCAEEIVRVLKPGGRLICAVPFLQPYHGYPGHYYNMTWRGVANLFERELEIDGVEVMPRQRPIWSLTWIVQSWQAGLAGDARDEFLDLRIDELLRQPLDAFVARRFVTELAPATNRELAAATVLCARKPR